MLNKPRTARLEGAPLTTLFSLLLGVLFIICVLLCFCFFASASAFSASAALALAAQQSALIQTDDREHSYQDPLSLES